MDQIRGVHEFFLFYTMPAYLGIGQHTKSIAKQKVFQIIIMRAYFSGIANLQAFGSVSELEL